MPETTSCDDVTDSSAYPVTLSSSPPALTPDPSPPQDRGSVPFAGRKRGSQPRVLKLRYHQYVPPELKERTPLTSTQLLQLQLQLIKHTQHHYPIILPAPPRPPGDQWSPLTKGTSGAPGRPAAPETAEPVDLRHLKVAQLRLELKKWGLNASGTKSSLIERLRNFHQLRPHQPTGQSGASLSVVLMAKNRDGPAGGPAPPDHAGSEDPNRDAGGTMVSSSLYPHSPQDIIHSKGSLSNAPCVPRAFRELTPPPPLRGPAHSSDRDRIMKEKDRRISELTLMLQQKQQLVEELRARLRVKEVGGGASHSGAGLDTQETGAGALRHTHHQRKKSYKQHQALPTFLSGQSPAPIQNGHVPPKQQKIFKQPIRKTLKPERRKPANQSGDCPAMPALDLIHALSPSEHTREGPKHREDSSSIGRSTYDEGHSRVGLAPPLSLASPRSERLEDFLESATGRPLLGVEPGGVAPIDELHGQLLSTPSILECPTSPTDTFYLDPTGSGAGGVARAEVAGYWLEGPRLPLDTFDLDPMGGRGVAEVEGGGYWLESPASPLDRFELNAMGGGARAEFLDTSDLHWDSGLLSV